MKSRFFDIPVVASEINFRGPSLLNETRSKPPPDKNNYFLYTNYRSFREDMIKRIDKEKITSSFVELRELGASLRTLNLQPDNIDEILQGLESKSQIKKEKEESPEKTDMSSSMNMSPKLDGRKEQTKMKHLEILTNIKKQKESEPREKEEDQLFELRNEENLKKILGNLELYLSSNLKEIKDFRDAMSKQDKMHLRQSINKFPDESYENTPLANNATNERAQFLKRIANMPDSNVNVFLNDLDLLTEEIGLIENKANQLEINKLINKIKGLSTKEEKHLQEISASEEKIAKINDFGLKVCMFLRVELSAVFNDEEINRNVTDYLLKFEYQDAILTILEDVIHFWKGFKDEEAFFQFEYASISDIIQIFNNKFNTNIFLSEEKKDDKKKSSLEFNNNQFSGFQIKFWSEGILKAIYLKCPTFEVFQKLDHILFIYNLRRNMKQNEFLYKNPKYPMFFGGHEDFVSFSQTSMQKIQSNANINSDCQIGEGISPSKRKDKKSILTFDNNNLTNSIKKKKVTHFQLNDMRSNPSIMLESTHSQMKLNSQTAEELRKLEESKRNLTFDPEADYHTYLESTEKERKDSVMEMHDSRQKLLELEMAEQEILARKEKIFNDPKYQFAKARKNLTSGYVFMKYGKMGEPHERFIVMPKDPENKNLLECRPFNTKTSKKVFEIEKLQTVQFEKGGGNFQRFSKISGDGSLRFSLIFPGNKRLDLESSSEVIKKNFLDSLEIFLNKIRGKEY